MPSIKYNLKSIIGSVNSIVLSSAGNRGSEDRINKLSEMSGAAHVGALVTCLAFTGLMGTLTTIGIKQDFQRNSLAFASYEDEILEDIARINKQISIEPPRLAFSKNTSFNPHALLGKHAVREQEQGLKR